MSDTPRKAEGWTVETALRHMEVQLDALRVQIRSQFESQEEAMRAALEYQRESTKLLEDHAQQWRISANEWRNAMNDREKKFITSDVAMTRWASFDKEIADLKTSRDRLAGMGSGINASSAVLATVLCLLTAVATAIFTYMAARK